MKVQSMYSFNPNIDGEITMSFHTDEVSFEIIELTLKDAEEIVKSLSDGLETIREHIQSLSEKVNKNET